MTFFLFHPLFSASSPARQGHTFRGDLKPRQYQLNAERFKALGRSGDVVNPMPETINIHQLGVSENSVPLKPMVLLIIIPIKWLFVWEYTLFSDKPNYRSIIWG